MCFDPNAINLVTDYTWHLVEVAHKCIIKLFESVLEGYGMNIPHLAQYIIPPPFHPSQVFSGGSEEGAT